MVKSGRTHLMDAVPVTLGQEFAGYAAQVQQGSARVNSTLTRVGQIPLGGTATGTGLNTHPEFAARVRERLEAESGLTISPPADPFEAQAARDALVEASGALKTVAVSLTKIANDLRLMGSGPRAGLAEIFLPELQKGSSIMPGKVNPVMPEVVTQVAAQVIGNDQAITVGGMQGHFELNVFVPLIARNLLDSIKLLAKACRLLAEKCVDGIEANREQCERYAELTLSAATALNPYMGYDLATEIVKEAAASGRSLREVAREKGIADDVLDKALDYRAMAKPQAPRGGLSGRPSRPRPADLRARRARYGLGALGDVPSLRLGGASRPGGCDRGTPLSCHGCGPCGPRCVRPLSRHAPLALLVRPVRRAHERAREDRAESHPLALLAEHPELVGVHPAVDGRMLGRRLEVLADGDDVDARAGGGRASCRAPRRCARRGRR